MFSVLGMVLGFVSVQRGLLANLERCGIFWRCATVLGVTPGLFAITGSVVSVVVSKGRCMHHCMCL